MQQSMTAIKTVGIKDYCASLFFTISGLNKYSNFKEIQNQ